MRRSLRTIVLGVVAIVSPSCLQSRLTPCGDELCPAGAICIAGGPDTRSVCATGDQVAACTGIADDETCSVGGGVGRCDRGACIAVGCGNGAIDLGEACDDGNQHSGDGCRADCQKLEACGDNVVDQGEGCDDGNANPADGCDACRPTAWRATVVIGGSSNAEATGINAQAVAVDRANRIYIADNLRVRRVDANGAITTVAGNGTAAPLSAPLLGDGGPATSAPVSPSVLTIDGLGNLYIGCYGAVRRVDPFGTITTVAGTGGQGTSGDGGPATSAEIGRPAGLAVDGLGTLYIADPANHRVRRVDPTGMITTFAGTGTAGFSGDGGPATSAALNAPSGVALDAAGNVLVADAYNHRVRKIDLAGTITTVAGNGGPFDTGDGGSATGASIGTPTSIAIDRDRAFYIGETYTHVIRRVDAAGIITTVAGFAGPGFSGDGGPAVAAQLDDVSGIALDADGLVYLADNARIRKIDADGTIHTIAGDGTPAFTGDGGAATAAPINGVRAIPGPDGIYIADTFYNRIRRVDASGVISTIAGTGTMGTSGDDGPATAARLSRPFGIAFDSAGRLYIASTAEHRIRRVDATGQITAFAGSGVRGFAGDGGPAIDARFNFPNGIAIDVTGNVYVADDHNNRIRRIDPAGVITTVAGTGASGSAGDGGPAVDAQLDGPEDVAVDGAGKVYVADTYSHRIRRIDNAGVITTVAGTGSYGFSGDMGSAIAAQLTDPQSVAVDAIGNLYIADTYNDRIRRVDPSGIITTIAGTGDVDYAGDGGSAIAAATQEPTGVAVDGAGTVYVIGDRSGLRRIDAAGIITTIAGAVDPQGTGPLALAQLSDPRALVVTPALSVFASGSTGMVQIVRAARGWLEVAAGRYPNPDPVGTVARYRGKLFGDVGGVAYDAAAQTIYLTESSTNRIDLVTMVIPDDPTTWTLRPVTDPTGTPGFADGPVGSAVFRGPTGLYLDDASRQLYVADTGNHVIRAIDLSLGVANATVRTVVGAPATLGYFGDGGPALGALLFAPRAVTRCANGDLFVADTGNHRVRRVAAATGTITTVLGVGVAASSGEGHPASAFPVNTPQGLACDALGNLFVTSTTTMRLVPSDATGIVDGTGLVHTIYGAPPRDTYPSSVTSCLTGLAVTGAATVQVTDSCSGLLVELRREPS